MLKQIYKIKHFNYANKQKSEIQLFEKKKNNFLIKRIINFINNKKIIYKIIYTKVKNKKIFTYFLKFKNIFNFNLNKKIKNIFLPKKISKFSVLKSSFIHKKAQKSYKFILFKQLNMYILNNKKLLFILNLYKYFNLIFKILLIFFLFHVLCILKPNLLFLLLLNRFYQLKVFF